MVWHLSYISPISPLYLPYLLDGVAHDALDRADDVALDERQG